MSQNEDPPSARSWERIHELDKTLSTSIEARKQQHDENIRRFDTQDAALGRILQKQDVTNGRVSRLERWQERMIGALAIIMVVLLPIAGYLIKAWFDQLFARH